MSIHGLPNPGDPANHNSPMSPMNRKVLKVSNPRLGDWILTGTIVGIFAIGIFYAVIKNHFG